VWALGNAGTQSCGLWEFLSAGAMSKHLHSARGAEAGVVAALLAQEDFTGPDTILEGEKGFFKALCPDPVPSAVTGSPDAPWELMRSSVKPWPCCRHTHPAIDAAIALHAELGGSEVAHADVATYRAAIDVCDRPEPGDPYGAKFSLQHCVGAALLHGRVEQSSFGEAGRRGTDVIRSNIALHVSKEIDAAYPAAWGAEITVRTTGGKTLTVRRPVCKGDPENPLTATELATKARSLMESGGLDSRSAASVIDAATGLAKGQPVRTLALLDHTRPARHPARAAKRA